MSQIPDGYEKCSLADADFILVGGWLLMDGPFERTPIRKIVRKPIEFTVEHVSEPYLIFSVDANGGYIHVLTEANVGKRFREVVD